MPVLDDLQGGTATEPGHFSVTVPPRRVEVRIDRSAQNLVFVGIRAYSPDSTRPGEFHFGAFYSAAAYQSGDSAIAYGRRRGSVLLRVDPGARPDRRSRLGRLRRHR